MSDIHAVITGGGKGIGAATAKALTELGLRVTLMGRDAAALEATAAPLGARSIICDVTDRRSVEVAFSEAGSVDVLVNNAGSVESAPLERTDPEMWDRMLAVNLTGSFNCTREVLPTMRAQLFGRIVNVASTAALVGYPYVSAYCAAKHGLLGFTRALAREVAKEGITVNAVCPGYTDTDLLASSVSNIISATGRSEESVRQKLLESNPSGRFITAEEVGSVIAFLCSDAGAAITGQAIPIDGGETA